MHMYHKVKFLLTCRSKEDGSCEMICGLNIARDLLKAPIEYKYVIFSPKMKTEQDCYEFLHSFSKMLQNSNRCISITGAQGYESFEGTYYIVLYHTCHSPKSISLDSSTNFPVF